MPFSRWTSPSHRRPGSRLVAQQINLPSSSVLISPAFSTQRLQIWHGLSRHHQSFFLAQHLRYHRPLQMCTPPHRHSCPHSILKHPSAPPVHAVSEYRLSSTKSFLSGPTTNKPATYANKPSQIDVVAAFKCGWINGGKDWLVCEVCNVSWVLAGRNGMASEAGKKVDFRNI